MYLGLGAFIYLVGISSIEILSFLKTGHLASKDQILGMVVTETIIWFIGAYLLNQRKRKR